MQTQPFDSRSHAKGREERLSLFQGGTGRAHESGKNQGTHKGCPYGRVGWLKCQRVLNSAAAVLPFYPARKSSIALRAMRYWVPMRLAWSEPSSMRAWMSAEATWR